MGAVAGGDGITRVVLPYYPSDQLAELLAWEHSGSKRDAGPFEQLIELSRDYFNGKTVDFGPIKCALPGEGSFSGRVLRCCMKIPYGQTESYGRLAIRIGADEAARAVATALSKNNIPLVIPCHRVTYSDGRPGGFSTPGGPEMKQRMLQLESQSTPQSV